MLMVSWGQRFIDASLVGLLVFAPLFLGGRHPLGRWVYSILILVGVIGFLFCLLGKCRFGISSGLLMVIGIGMLLPGIQCIPLELSVTDWLAPGAKSLAGNTLLDTGQPHLGRTFSVAPAVTKNAWPSVIGYGAFFCCLVIRIQSWRDVENILAILVIGSGFLAALAIAQASLGNGKFLWIYDHPTREPLEIPRGPFQNENHLCNILAISLPALLYFIAVPFGGKHPSAMACAQQSRYAVSSSQKTTITLDRQLVLQWLAVILLIPICSTIYATPSRGGAIVALTGILGTIGFVSWSLFGTKLNDQARVRWWRTGWTGLAIIFVCFLASLIKLIPTLSYWRMKIWWTSLAIWKDFPILGTGLGTHRYVYRAYFDQYFEKTFATCESSWLQILAESGLVGIAVMITIVAMTGVALGRNARLSLSLRESLLLGALFGGLAVTFLHAFVDFPWHIPACVIPAITLAAIVFRFHTLLSNVAPKTQNQIQQNNEGLSFEKNLAVAFLLIIGVGFGVFSGVKAAKASFAWDDLRRQFRDNETLLTKPQNHTIRQLQSILQSEPHHVEARIQYLQILVAALQNPSELKLNPEKLSHEVRLQAVRCRNLVPSDGRAYFLLATTAIQQGLTLQQQGHLLEQAQHLRKVDGNISMHRAIHSFLDGNPQHATVYWKQAVQHDPTTRTPAWQVLTQIYPTADLLEMLEPNHDAGQALFRLLVTRQQWEDASIVGNYLCDAAWKEIATAESDEEVQFLLRRTLEYAVVVQDPKVKIEVLDRLVHYDRKNLSHRIELAHAYLENQQMTKAKEQLEEAIRLDPLNREARELLVECEKRQRLAHAPTSPKTRTD